jgi:hypothetical protein
MQRDRSQDTCQGSSLAPLLSRLETEPLHLISVSKQNPPPSAKVAKVTGVRATGARKYEVIQQHPLRLSHKPCERHSVLTGTYSG